MIDKTNQEKLENLFCDKKGYGFFGVMIEPTCLTTIGFGKINLNEKAHAILALRKFADLLEKELFNLHKNYNQ